MRRSKAILSTFLLATLAAGAATATPEPPQKLVYAIHHSQFGQIGTFTNTIIRDGDATDVSTEIRVKVSFLGVGVFHQQASRHERWEGGRLVSFHGVTTTNGSSIELTGAAEGDHFVMKTPDGATVAPASVTLADPWQAPQPDHTFMFTPDRGRLDQVRIQSGDTVVPDGAHMVRARKYEIYYLDGRKKYEVDVDGQGKVVQFVMFNADSSVTFSLQS